MKPYVPPLPSRKVWLWYICKTDHVKILSEYKPVCPICHWVMQLKEEDGK